jgi:P27 family predicted phage terminase small subunit
MPGTSNSGGRNAKSPEQHKALGTFQNVRHEGFENPNPPKGKPQPPKSVTGEALAEWNRMVDRMEQSQTLSMVDDAALYQYVQLFAETEGIKADNANVRRLSESLKKAVRKLNGPELLDAIKQVCNLQHIIAKQTTQLRQGHMAMRQYLVEFGMTPSSRTRVKIPKESKPKSKLVAFTGGKLPPTASTE